MSSDSAQRQAGLQREGEGESWWLPKTLREVLVTVCCERPQAGFSSLQFSENVMKLGQWSTGRNESRHLASSTTPQTP